MPRRSDYTEEISAVILDRLAGGESLAQICADETMPDRRTVYRWMATHEEFAAECARAREELVESHYDDMDDIEADVLSGKLDPKAANVVLANKRWRLEKLKPKVYGVKVDHSHKGTLTLESLVAGEGE